MLKNFGHFEMVHLVFCKIFKLLWLILNAIGQFFIAVNGQKLIKQCIHLVTLLATLVEVLPRVLTYSETRMVPGYLWTRVRLTIFKTVYEK